MTSAETGDGAPTGPGETAEPGTSAGTAEPGISAGTAESEDILATSEAGPAAVRGGALRVGGFGLSAIASIGSAALLYRHLGVDELGRYVTIMSLVAIVAGITDLGLTAIGVREAASSSGEERARTLRDLLGMRVTLTALGIVALAAIALAAYSSTVALGVLIGGAALMLQTTQDNYAILLVAGLRLRWVAALDLLKNAGTAALIVILALSDAKLLAFVAAGALPALIALGINGRLVRGERSLLPSLHIRRWGGLLRHVLPYSAAVATSTLYFRAAIVMTSLIASARQLGLFSASFRMIEVLTLVPGLLAGSALPIFARAARDDHDRLGYALERVFEVALIVGAWVALSLAVGASLAFKLIGGAQFSDASGVLAIQGIALGATFVTAVWAYGLLSLELYRKILLLNAVALVASLALMAVLVPLDGARGAATGTAIAEAGTAVAGAFLLVSGRPALRPRLRVIPRVALATALGALPMLLTGTPVVVRLILSTAIYVLVLALTRAFPEELDALRTFAFTRRAA